MKRLLKNFLRIFGYSPTNGSNALRDHSWLERIKTPTYQKWLIAVATSLILTLILSPSFHPNLREYDIGDVATKDIRSTQDLLIEDEKSTHEKRLEAEKSILSVYDYDPSVLMDIQAKIRTIFPAENPASDRGKTSDPNLKQRMELRSVLRLHVTPKEWGLLEKKGFPPEYGEAVLKLLSPILRKGVVPDKDLLDPEADRGIVIRNIQTRVDRKEFPPFTFLDIKEAKAKLRDESHSLQSSMDATSISIAVKIAEQFLRPNVTFNKDETEDRKIKARERVNPVYFQIKRGEVILRAGDRVRADHVSKIKALQKVYEGRNKSSIVVGMAVLAFMVIATIYQFAADNIRKFTLSLKDLVFVCSTMIGTVASLKLFVLVTDALGEEFFSIPSSSYQFLFPVAASAMMVRIVINSEVALIFSIVTSYFVASLTGNQLFFFVYSLVGSIIGAHRVAQCEQRTVILKAGLAVGLGNSLLLLAYHLLSGTPLSTRIFYDLGFSFINGIVAGILVIGITPVVENLFGYTTDIKLLELASMDHPLIKDLILQAPGTYHHSVIVGNLAEAAAKAVSANPLLAKVSAYYHDIGKLKKPLYFVENAGRMESKHDRLSPHMSSLILISHVKDGLELARENRLGARIAHIIQQHHGTSLNYFFQKAKELQIESVNEAEFRYPGPKPQTKEAGLVMLADEVEAASRTLSDPNPSQIRSLVQRIISRVFLDGQLEECELTLKDLHKIEESFTRILNAIFHQRIEYPQADSKETTKRQLDEGSDSKPTDAYSAGLVKNKKSRPKDIDRIGIS